MFDSDNKEWFHELPCNLEFSCFGANAASFLLLSPLLFSEIHIFLCFSDSSSRYFLSDISLCMCLSINHTATTRLMSLLPVCLRQSESEDGLYVVSGLMAARG